MQRHDDLIKINVVRYATFTKATCNNAVNTRGKLIKLYCNVHLCLQNKTKCIFWGVTLSCILRVHATVHTHEPTHYGVLRIELKFLLYFVRNRCARTFTPERLKLELIVSWQVNKNYSPVSSTSILGRRQKDVINCASLSNNQFTNTWDQKLCSAWFILQNISF